MVQLYQITHDECETNLSGTIDYLLKTKCDGCKKPFLETSDFDSEDFYK